MINSLAKFQHDTNEAKIKFTHFRLKRIDN